MSFNDSPQHFCPEEDNETTCDQIGVDIHAPQRMIYHVWVIS